MILELEEKSDITAKLTPQGDLSGYRNLLNS